ncbi:hypothetical protein L6452_03500 [Arctium lappa]|uniref:Uncharacterized protein n=1 Tax=Arctium lappa TaxID=4217 RepID=A0ACB9FMZ6_ARCLA|nr:hypothetical protein L6452_03500 [Arctium lappa]
MTSFTSLSTIVFNLIDWVSALLSSSTSLDYGPDGVMPFLSCYFGPCPTLSRMTSEGVTDRLLKFQISNFESENLNPISDPNVKFQGLIEGLESKDWLKICDSLNDVRCTIRGKGFVDFSEGNEESKKCFNQYINHGFLCLYAVDHMIKLNRSGAYEKNFQILHNIWTWCVVSRPALLLE